MKDVAFFHVLFGWFFVPCFGLFFGLLFRKDDTQRGDSVTFAHLHDANTLGGATKSRDFLHGDANGLTLSGHHNDFFG